MIQRIQSIWFLLAAVAAFLGYKLFFYTGNKIGADKIEGFYTLNATNSIGTLLLTAIIGVMSLLAIFLYKNRKRQLQLGWGALLLSIVNILLYYLQTKNFVAGKGAFSITAIVTLLVPVFLILAIRGVAKDQKLVKSLDRLR